MIKVLKRTVLSIHILFLFSLPTFAQFKILQYSPATAKLGCGEWNITLDGELVLMKELLQPSSVIFDVGGNLGEWSLYAVQTEPTIKLMTFEPVPDAYTRLKEILTKYKNIEVYNLGLSNKNGSSNFYYYNDNQQEWGLSGFYYREVLHGDHPEPEIISVQHQTLDDFCLAHDISEIRFIKIDTEGSEWNIINGAQRMLKNHQIHALQFEYGGCYIDAKVTLEQVMRLLTSHNYVIFRIYSEGLIHIPQWKAELENYDLCNYCAFRIEDAMGYGLTKFE